jgi:hypothetical protein
MIPASEVPVSGVMKRHAATAAAASATIAEARKIKRREASGESWEEAVAVLMSEKPIRRGTKKKPLLARADGQRRVLAR